jgi:hypothetical protein
MCRVRVMMSPCSDRAVGPRAVGSLSHIMNAGQSDANLGCAGFRVAAVGPVTIPDTNPKRERGSNPRSRFGLAWVLFPHGDPPPATGVSRHPSKSLRSGGFLFPQHQVERPAAADVRGGRVAQVGEQVVAVAPGVLERIGQDRQAVEGTLGVDALS